MAGKRQRHSAKFMTELAMEALRGELGAAQVRISMLGRGRRMDNVYIEQLRRSLKSECVDLHAFETGSEMRIGLARGD